MDIVKRQLLSSQEDIKHEQAALRGAYLEPFHYSASDFDAIDLFLSRIISGTDEPDEALLTEVEEIIELAHALSLPVHIGLAHLAVLRPTWQPRATAIIAADLRHPTSSTLASAAAYAVAHWAAHATAHNQSVPAPVILGLLSRLGTDHYPAPQAATNAARLLLAYAPAIMCPSYFEALLAALDRLLTTTFHPANGDRLVAAGRMVAEENLLQRPEVAEQAAALAALVQRLLPPDAPAAWGDILARWQEAATASPYPAVRRAWHLPTPE